jgi:hypothetical protein
LKSEIQLEKELQRLQYAKKHPDQLSLEEEGSLQSHQNKPWFRNFIDSINPISQASQEKRQQYRNEAEANEEEIRRAEADLTALRKRQKLLAPYQPSHSQSLWDDRGGAIEIVENINRGGAIGIVDFDLEIQAIDIEIAESYALLGELEEAYKKLLMYFDPIFLQIRLCKITQSLNLSIQDFADYGIPLDLGILGFDISPYLVVTEVADKVAIDDNSSTKVENIVTVSNKKSTKVGSRLPMRRKGPSGSMVQLQKRYSIAETLRSIGHKISAIPKSSRSQKVIDGFVEGLGWVAVIKLVEMTVNPSSAFGSGSPTVSPRPLQSPNRPTEIVHERSAQRPEDRQTQKIVEQKIRDGDTKSFIRIKTGDTVLVFSRSNKAHPIQNEAAARREAYRAKNFPLSDEQLRNFDLMESDFELSEEEEARYHKLLVEDMAKTAQQRAEYYQVSENSETPPVAKKSSSPRDVPLPARTKTLSDLPPISNAGASDPVKTNTKVEPIRAERIRNSFSDSNQSDLK